MRARWLEPLAFVIGAIVVGYQLFCPPVIGLADEGDFARVMGPVGIQYVTESRDLRYYGFLTSKYSVGPAWWHSGQITSETLLAGIARLLSVGFARSGSFDIRFLGAVHAALLLGGIAALFFACRGLCLPSRVAVVALVVFIFTDVGYVALGNSFYSAASSLVFLLLLAGLVACVALRRSSTPVWVAYWLAAGLFVTSKPQEAIHAPILGMLGVLLCGRTQDRRFPALPIFLGAILAAIGAVYYETTPDHLKSEALYNDVFFEVLFSSKTPAKELHELGLPESWLRYSGTHAYQTDAGIKDPAFRDEFMRRIGYRKLVLFYLQRPVRLAQVLRTASQRAFRLRQSYLGNFTPDSGAKPRELSHAFELWSSWKAHLGPIGPLFLPIFLLVNLGGALLVSLRAEDARSRHLGLGVVILVVMSILEFMVCAFADALADVARHLHAFNAMFDLLLIADISWLISLIACRPSARFGAEVTEIPVATAG